MYKPISISPVVVSITAAPPPPGQLPVIFRPRFSLTWDPKVPSYTLNICCKFSINEENKESKDIRISAFLLKDVRGFTITPVNFNMGVKVLVMMSIMAGEKSTKMQGDRSQCALIRSCGLGPLIVELARGQTPGDAYEYKFVALHGGMHRALIESVILAGKKLRLPPSLGLTLSEEDKAAIVKLGRKMPPAKGTSSGELGDEICTPSTVANQKS